MKSADSQFANLTVIVVDDEAVIREFASTVLHRIGFQVLSACSASEALTLSRNRLERIDLLVTDFQMGDGLNGIELAESILQDRAGIAVQIISGSPESERLAAEKGHPCLAKPFTSAKLTERVRELLTG